MTKVSCLRLLFYSALATRLMSASEMILKTVDFEVFGRVQGVWFRAYTEKTAKKLGLTGWCRNTAEGTVAGQVEGEEVNVNKMMVWLEKEGSPQSRIERTVFGHEDYITQRRFKEFKVRD